MTPDSIDFSCLLFSKHCLQIAKAHSVPILTAVTQAEQRPVKRGQSCQHLPCVLFRCPSHDLQLLCSQSTAATTCRDVYDFQQDIRYDQTQELTAIRLWPSLNKKALASEQDLHKQLKVSILQTPTTVLTAHHACQHHDSRNAQQV